MIKYINDYEKKYEQDLIKHLRGHNERFTGKVEFKNLYVYIVDENELIGGIALSCGWNWASMSKVHYKDLDTLKVLITNVWHQIQHEYLGIKFFSPIKERYDDFMSVGFTHQKKLEKLGEYDEFYYAVLTSYKESTKTSLEVIISDKPHEIYQKELDQKEEAFEKKHNLKDKTDDFMYIALEGDVCVGGVSGEIYEKTIYISRLAVDPAFKNQKIGSMLMKLVEEEAKTRGIQFLELGTTDFQARPFYEKLGYKVVFEMDDYPKGYKCYTLFKELL
ncbi:hypothetical protein BK011_08850 [Tenericutes bacterium MZ-XQ]|nr:hypothetical protein BK011_08850 [Tenericutes bacterium MZ-XQ]